MSTPIFQPWSPDSRPAQGIHEHPTMKLGLRESRPGRMRLPLAAFVSELPPFPERFDFTTRLANGHVAPVFGNDKCGDCLDVSMLNYIRVAKAAAGNPVTFVDPDDAINLYKLDTGYDPDEGDGEFNPTDQGSDADELLERMVRDGYLGHKFDAAATLDIRDTPHLLAGMYALNGVALDFQLPRKVFEMGDRWAVPWLESNANDIIGQHSVFACGYGQLDGFSKAMPATVFVYSWGRFIEVTPEFRLRYGIRAHAILSKEMLNPLGYGMNALDYDGVVKAYQRIIA